MTVSFWIKEHKKRKCDCIIVGGGISGLSLAYWLKKSDNQLKITLLEAVRVGYGASSRNAGFLLRGVADSFARAIKTYGKDKAEELWESSFESIQLLKKEVIDVAPQYVDYSPSGILYGAKSEVEREELKESFELYQELGWGGEWISEAKIKEILPIGDWYGGLYDKTGFGVNPYKLILLLKKIVEERGVKIVEGEEVYEIQGTSLENLKYYTNKGEWSSQFGIIATNGYMPLIHNYFKEKVYPTRGQVLATTPLKKFKLFCPVYADFGYEYFRQLKTGEVILGGWRQHYKQQELGYSDEVTEQIQQGLEQFFVTNIYPELPPIQNRWSGIMGFSRDGYPFMGSLPSLPQLYFIGGYTGHGFSFAFGLCKKLEELIIQGTQPGIFSVRRFEIK